MKRPLRTAIFFSISPFLLTRRIHLTFLCFILTQQLGQTQTCIQSLGYAHMLCYSSNGNGTATIFLAEGNTIVQKILDKNGATLSSSVAGNFVQDSVLVRNNQVIKKLVNGTIAYTKNIPPSVLNRAPSIKAAVEMTDGTFVLGGYQKFFDPIFPPNNKDSLVLITTDANLNFQSSFIQARNSGPYTPQLDSLVQLIPLPNNQFLVTYYLGFEGIINRASFNFSTFQKTGANLAVIKSSSYGYREQNQPIITSVCGKNMILHGDISTYGQKGSFRGIGDALFNIDSMLPITSKTVGTGNADYYGDYKTYSYIYRPVLRDTAYQLFVNYKGDPRPSLNDFSKLEIKFFNNTNINTSPPTFTKIIPFVAFDHIIRTGDTTCLVLMTENGQLKVYNPDCNNAQSLPDLTLANLTIPTPSVQQGQILNWKVDIKNIGTTAATANFNVKAYISKDTILSADDVQDGIIPTGNFAAGLVQTQVVGASTVVSTIPAGQYYLILKVDAAEQIAEGDETNNILVSTSTFTVTAVQTGSYCTSKSVTPWELWTRNVSFNTINNTSEKFKDYATLGFSNYTNLSTTVNKGQSYPLSILPPTGWNGYFPNVFCRVWIDFNNNNVFEDNEKMLEQTNANTFTTNVLIPTTAATGSIRMRVSMKWGGYPTACETFEKGEVEDYTVQITEGGQNNLPDFTISIDQAVVALSQNPPTLTVVGRFGNLGTVGADNLTVKVYISRDTIISADDKISFQNMTAFAGYPIPNYTSINYDLQPWTSGTGIFYIIGVVDEANTITESNESNNKSIYKIDVNPVATTNDIALTLSSTPSVYTRYTPLNFTISAKNNGNQAFTNVKIEFKFPTGTTNGGTATPSVGTWQEWCAGGTQCFTWTIPTLVANANATLNVPVYVLNPTSPMVATAKLLASTPVDNVVTNNTATISLNTAPPPARSIQAQPTQLIPIVVEKITPNPSDDEVTVELESLETREVWFDFSDAFGKTVKREVRKVERGTNRVLFEVFDLPQGIYFVSPSTNKGKNVPTKFVKM